MRVLLLSILTVLFGAADVRRRGRRARAQVAAATADALDTLQRDVLSAPVTPELTVQQFVEQTGSRESFTKALRRAEQIGGTRWLDDQTCQVRLELPGSDVADALVQIAESKSGAAGLPVDVLRKRVDHLREMTFAATGMSTGAVDRLRPPPDRVEWRDVPDDAVRAAVSEARCSAAGQVLQSVEDVKLPGEPDARLGNSLNDQKVRDCARRLADEPAGDVRRFSAGPGGPGGGGGGRGFVLGAARRRGWRPQ